MAGEEAFKVLASARRTSGGGAPARKSRKRKDKEKEESGGVHVDQDAGMEGAEARVETAAVDASPGVAAAPDAPTATAADDGGGGSGKKDGRVRQRRPSSASSSHRKSQEKDGRVRLVTTSEPTPAELRGQAATKATELDTSTEQVQALKTELEGLQGQGMGDGTGGSEKQEDEGERMRMRQILLSLPVKRDGEGLSDFVVATTAVRTAADAAADPSAAMSPPDRAAEMHSGDVRAPHAMHEHVTGVGLDGSPLSGAIGLQSPTDGKPKRKRERKRASCPPSVTVPAAANLALAAWKGEWGARQGRRGQREKRLESPQGPWNEARGEDEGEEGKKKRRRRKSDGDKPDSTVEGGKDEGHKKKRRMSLPDEVSKKQKQRQVKDKDGGHSSTKKEKTRKKAKPRKPKPPPLPPLYLPRLSTDFAVPQSCVRPLLGVWEFAVRFKKQLGIAAVPLQELERAVGECGRTEEGREGEEGVEREGEGEGVRGEKERGEERQEDEMRGEERRGEERRGEERVVSLFREKDMRVLGTVHAALVLLLAGNESSGGEADWLTEADRQGLKSRQVNGWAREWARNAERTRAGKRQSERVSEGLSYME